MRNVLCEGNCLCELPSSVGCMGSLRTLDLSENSIRELPKELANVRTLEVSVKPVIALCKSLKPPFISLYLASENLDFLVLKKKKSSGIVLQTSCIPR